MGPWDEMPALISNSSCAGFEPQSVQGNLQRDCKQIKHNPVNGGAIAIHAAVGAVVKLCSSNHQTRDAHSLLNNAPVSVQAIAIHTTAIVIVKL